MRTLSASRRGGVAHNRARLAGLGEGVSYLICHPAMPGEELSAITDSAHCRAFEKDFYGGPDGCMALEEEGIRTVGMRVLRDWMRSRDS